LAGCAVDPEVAKLDHVRRGDEYVKQAKHAEAIVEYRTAVQLDPQFGEALFKVAEAYAAAGQGEDALKAYLRAADVKSASAEAQLKAGQVLLLARSFADARTRALAILQRDAKNPQALLLLANALAGLKSMDEAVAANRQAIALDPKRAGMYVNLGALEYIQGNVDEAEAAYKASVAADPTSLMGVLGLAEFYSIVARDTDAERVYKEALALDVGNVTANRAIAMFYLQTGRRVEAERFLKKIAETSKTTESMFDLVDFYISGGRHREAADILQVMRTKPVAFATASVKLALIASIDGFSKEALRIVDEILAREPSNASAMALRAQVLLRDRRRTEAFAAAQAAVKSNPKLVAAQFAYGLAAKARGETTLAKGAFLEVLKLSPNSLEALLELADLHLQARLPDSALDFAEQAVRMNPRLVEARLMLVRVLASQPDNTARVTVELGKLQREHPSSAAVQLEVGRVAVARKDAAAAAQAFQRAAQLDPNSLDAVVELVKLDLGAGRIAAARVRVDDALRKRPDSPALLLFAGKAYLSLDPTVAEKYLLRAVELDSSNIDSYGTLVILYIARGELEPARQQFEMLAEQQPLSAAPPTMVGVLYQAQGKIDKAEEWYEKALRITPRATTAANNLAWLYAEGGKNLDRALELAKNAHEDMPDRVEVTDTLGWVHLKKGMAESAVRYFKDCVELAPADPSYQYHLGLAYSRTGDHAKARVALEASLKINPKFRDAADAKAALSKLIY
jgi:tetratricopeptide (TPR) repeat protein